VTSAVATSTIRTPGPWNLGRGLTAFVWLLPIHILVMAFLFGGLGWPGPAVRVIAAWKEMLVAVLFGLVLVRVVWHRGPRPTVHWLDLAVGGLGILAFAYVIGASVWFDAGLPIGAQLYGLRDTAFVSLLYFVGRATPEVAEDPRFLRALFVIGVATSVIAILERLFVTPGMLVLLGATRYIQDFLGASALTTGNVYGLPDNYWTQIGSHLVRRVGSTYLSAQGFAIPFLVVLPAATLWVLEARRRRLLAWTGYTLLWVALLLTITRMTIIACLLQTLIVAGVRRRWGLAVTVCTAAVGAFALVLVLFPGFADFIWETLTWQSGSSQSHLQDWGEAVDNLVRYPLGAGLGSTEQNAVRFGLTPLAADNQYFKYALELGIPGLLLHVAILVGILLAGVRAAWTAPTETSRTYGLLVATTALGIMLNAMTAAVINSMMLAYVFLWLAGALVTILDGGDAIGAVRA
jgi:hypothetical protein